jgi:hypothetical protein
MVVLSQYAERRTSTAPEPFKLLQEEWHKLPTDILTDYVSAQYAS